MLLPARSSSSVADPRRYRPGFQGPRRRRIARRSRRSRRRRHRPRAAPRGRGPRSGVEQGTVERLGELDREPVSRVRRRADRIVQVFGSGEVSSGGPTRNVLRNSSRQRVRRRRRPVPGRRPACTTCPAPGPARPPRAASAPLDPARVEQQREPRPVGRPELLVQLQERIGRSACRTRRAGGCARRPRPGSSAPRNGCRTSAGSRAGRRATGRSRSTRRGGGGARCIRTASRCRAVTRRRKIG